jgi:hypothetical protein
MCVAINWIYARVLVCLVWICLTGMLLIVSGRNVLYLLSGATPPRRPLAIPILIPLLLASYVFALYQPSLHAALSAMLVILTASHTKVEEALAPDLDLEATASSCRPVQKHRNLGMSRSPSSLDCKNGRAYQADGLDESLEMVR